MQQLSLFPEISYNEAWDFHQMLEECRSDYACRYIKKFDKPAGLPWDIWYSEVLESVKLNGPLVKTKKSKKVRRAS